MEWHTRINPVISILYLMKGRRVKLLILTLSSNCGFSDIKKTGRHPKPSFSRSCIPVGTTNNCRHLGSCNYSRWWVRYYSQSIKDKYHLSKIDELYDQRKIFSGQPSWPDMDFISYRYVNWIDQHTCTLRQPRLVVVAFIDDILIFPGTTKSVRNT